MLGSRGSGCGIPGRGSGAGFRAAEVRPNGGPGTPIRATISIRSLPPAGFIPSIPTMAEVKTAEPTVLLPNVPEPPALEPIPVGRGFIWGPLKPRNDPEPSNYLAHPGTEVIRLRVNPGHIGDNCTFKWETGTFVKTYQIRRIPGWAGYYLVPPGESPFNVVTGEVNPDVIGHWYDCYWYNLRARRATGPVYGMGPVYRLLPVD